MTGYMVSAYLPPDLATSRVDVQGDPVRYWLLVGHIGFGTIATVAGLAQFWPWLRRICPRAHRWVGRMYFYAGVFPAMVLTVPVVLASESGMSNVSALVAMLVMWAVTGVAGLRAARSRRFRDHRAWMIRNYAVTVAVHASRMWGAVVIPLVLLQADGPAYQGDTRAIIHDIAGSGAWLGLFVNLAVVEWYLRRRAQPVKTARNSSSSTESGTVPSAAYR
ncbi:DUF2306 domain-containing protein [Amycolatopsis sp. CA-230715]|uniref:DUF2306 domain-containing protein n=1 Tax=Amycolatopsis sp. CA-230715 TaxID=2745196 RepID=UPI001C025892|nr:DUF2306 domain-containing protein [Amycolatopsis sp. CA-230715]